MPNEATKGVEPDQYGQRHPVETPELVARALEDFRQEVARIPDKPCLLKAQRKCPHILTDDFQLMFLRADVFHADRAAKRYVHYWEKRVAIFRERAFGELTHENCLTTEMDQKTEQMGVFALLRVNHGRLAFFARPWRFDRSMYTLESCERYMWYMAHQVLNDQDLQKRGALVIGMTGDSKLSQFDSKVVQLVLTSLRGALPIRLSAVHVCKPGAIFRVIWPIIRLLLGERLRKRVLMHSGKDDEAILARLAIYGIEKKELPVELGGDYVVPDLPPKTFDCMVQGTT